MQLAKLYATAVALVSLILVACSCHTAQKPVALLPPATAPALKPAQQAAPVPPAATAEQPQEPPAQQPAPPGTNAPTSSAPAPDPVAGLIAKVEKEYQAGLANHQAGKIEEARQNFDNAFNALLGSNLDIHSDDRLQKEFDRIVEGVNQLDVSNVSAESEPQQKSEPAPIDETNGITPAADAGTMARVAAEVKNTPSDLPLMMTDQVAGYISYFSGRGRGVFERAFARSGRYHDMIVATLKEEGVPQDLIYLAQAESGFHPLAVSRAGARGIWQFMSSRARGYGLYHNMYVDDRQDPEKSTRAAARHLKDLYEQFGDWYLAMAAYNSGPGTVQAAVKRTGYADFWELYRRNVLPRETRNYVPIILAVAIMAKNPSQYGLDDAVLEQPAAYDTVSINYPVDLRLVAECVNSTPAELQDLNPHLLRWSTPHTGEFDMRLPAGTKNQYETAIANIPTGMRLWWRYHTVHSGDTLASLAHTYHVTAKAISEANHLDSADLETDAKLVIPIPPGKHPTSDNATYARRITRYRVHKGDTVESVAENFGVSPLMLRRWNGLHGDSLSGRKILALHLPVTPSAEVASSRTGHKSPTGTSSKSHAEKAGSSAETTAASTNSKQTPDCPAGSTPGPCAIHHTVKAGETLYSIAQTYKTTVTALKRDNHDVAVLRPGMILIVQVAR